MGSYSLGYTIHHHGSVSNALLYLTFLLFFLLFLFSSPFVSFLLSLPSVTFSFCFNLMFILIYSIQIKGVLGIHLLCVIFWKLIETIAVHYLHIMYFSTFAGSKIHINITSNKYQHKLITAKCLSTIFLFHNLSHQTDIIVSRLQNFLISQH